MRVSASRIEREQMPQFVTVAFVTFFAFLDKYLVGFTVKRLAETFGFATGDVSFMLSAFYAGFIVASLVGGYIVDRYGSRRFMVATMGILAVVSLAFGLSATLPLFIMLRAVAGLGQAGYSNGVPKVTRVGFRGEQVPYVQAKLGAICGVAGIVAATGGQWLLSSDATWRWAYVFLAVGFAIALVLAFRYAPKGDGARDRAQASGQPAVSLREAWLNRPTILLALAYLFNNIVVVAMINWLPSVTAGLPGAGDAPAGGIMIGFYVVEALTMYFSANLIRGRFWGHLPAFILATAAFGAVGLVVFVTATTFVASVAALYLATVFVLLSNAAILIMPFRYIPERIISSAFSLVYVGGYVGGMVSPFVVNALADGSGANFVAAFAVYAVILVISAVFVLLLPKLDAEHDMLG